MNDEVIVALEGHVGGVRFSRPPHNHVSIALLHGLSDAIEALCAEPECRAIVLSSEGSVFCAGADLAQDGSLGGQTADPTREFYDQALRLFRTTKPIVAAIQGAAIGAGLGLAMAADFRVASRDARLSANFTRLGYHPGFGLTRTLTEAIGAHRANLMLMTSRRFKPEEVAGWGLVDEVVDAPDLMDTARALAGEIAGNAPLSLIATRQTLRGRYADEVEQALMREHAEQAILRDTADFSEGVQSVFERRPAHFIGR